MAWVYDCVRVFSLLLLLCCMLISGLYLGYWLWGFWVYLIVSVGCFNSVGIVLYFIMYVFNYILLFAVIVIIVLCCVW